MVGRAESRKGNEKTMSLINEALKKAQSERPSSIQNHPVMQGGGHSHPQQKPPRKRRFLFGFIMAVLIVGLFSTGVSTYLVYQILGTDKSEEAGNAQAARPVEVATTQADPATATTPPPAETVKVQEPVVEKEVTEVVKAAPTTPVEAPVAQQPVPQEIVAPPPVVEVPAPEPAVVQAAGTDPSTWNRIDEFEIRGIMSRGEKVLIFDARNQRSKTYRPGDLIDGALSLRVASITTNVITFENNDGAQFRKSF
jgi:hypothetical protein